MSYLQKFFDKHNITCDYEKCLVGIHFEVILSSYMGDYSGIDTVMLEKQFYKDIDTCIVKQLTGWIEWGEPLDFDEDWYKRLGFEDYDDMVNQACSYLLNNMMPEFKQAVDKESYKIEDDSDESFKTLWESIFTSD